MNKYIVFSDVDGTLLDSKNKILPSTLYSINELKKKDIDFLIVSGRSPNAIYPLIKEYNIKCPLICYGGALILDINNNILYSKVISKDKAKTIIEYINKCKFDLTYNIFSYFNWIVPYIDKRVIHEQELVKCIPLVGTIDDIKEEGVHKLLLMCNPNQIDEILISLKNKFEDFNIVKSSNILIEINAFGVDKGIAIKEYCLINNISLDHTIAFGDNYNDIEMLETVKYGFILDNAPSDLKTRDFILTSSNDDDGIYNGLKSLNIID